MTMNVDTILCGHCKGRHNSVSEVKSCSLGVVETRGGLWGWNSPAKNVLPQGVGEAPKEAKEGRYAIEFNGQLRFYHIQFGKNKWAGYVFVKEQAGDDLYNVKNRTQREEILRAIAADDDAMARYGRELGVCGDCGRTLTDETSRAIGIGPVCRTK